MQSEQKGGQEQAHTMLRMVLPKGTVLEFLTQWDVNMIVNHINSTPRETLVEETPKAFQLRLVEPDQVNLTPKLICHKVYVVGNSFKYIYYSEQ